MYAIKVEHIALFKKVLEVVDKEYIDMLCMEHEARFIINSSEIFCVFRMPAKSESYAGDFSIRINRYLLHRLLIEGSLRLDLTETDVKVSFYNKEGFLHYSYVCLRQGVYDEEYSEKYNLLSSLDMDSVSTIDISELNRISMITRSLPSIVHVNNGLAGVMFGNGMRIYKKLQCKGEFSISSKALTTIYKFSRNVCNVKGYLCSKSEILWLCVTKCNAVDHSEFEFIEEQKSAYICDLNLGGLCNLYNQIDIKAPFVTLDFSSGVVALDYHNSRFTVPFRIENIRCADGFEMKELKLPSELVTKVFQKLGQFSFKFSKKRTFNQLETNDLIIIFR